MSDSNTKSGWVRIIEVIDKPLGFYVLALLIIEVFLGTVLIGSDLLEPHKYVGMLLGVGLFVGVVGVVSLIVFICHENLTFDKDAHLQDRNSGPFGADNHPLPDKAIQTLTRGVPPVVYYKQYEPGD